ncbi:MAG: IS3 family transposase [Oceanospirillaceae bacterium]
MAHYPTKKIEAIVNRYLNSGLSIRAFADQEGISKSTLYTWSRKFNNNQDMTMTTQYSSEQRFTFVLETATLSETELSQYCREKGLYPQQIKQWKVGFIEGDKQLAKPSDKRDKKRIKELEKELHRKEKALAETAALLVLRKKLQCPLQSGRGVMTHFNERQNTVNGVLEAIKAGASKTQACDTIELNMRTFQRWYDGKCVKPDLRPEAIRQEPANKLSMEERKTVLEYCNRAEYASLPPSQIVPILADTGTYIASESSFYRILKEENQLQYRGHSKPRKASKKPTSYTATAANQVWSWDISYLPTGTIGLHYYLYLIMDIYSRKIVGAEVFDSENGEDAAALLQRSVWSEKCIASNLVLHSDNGAPMKSFTLRAKMYDLGVVTSRSRPRVSNDNPYSEALFKTVKYCPQWPKSGFSSLDKARAWVDLFVDGYNEEHRHSGIRFVTPNERHEGQDIMILKQREQVYATAKQKKPERWSKNTRN